MGDLDFKPRENDDGEFVIVVLIAVVVVFGLFVTGWYLFRDPPFVGPPVPVELLDAGQDSDP